MHEKEREAERRHVQDKLWEQRAYVRALIDNGAHVYVCGDAAGMGRAVEETLRRIGAAITDGQDGTVWLEEMRKAGRYATDMY